MNYEFVEPNSPRWLSLEDLPNERWKDIEGYEGLYQISDYGRVKSLRKKYYGILRTKISKQGYCYAAISNNNIREDFRINRLVAIHFLGKCKYKNLQANHNDENKLNNYYTNITWMTPAENCNYGTRNKRVGEKQHMRVNQYDLNGNFIKTWNSLSEIGKVLNFSVSHISSCCNGYRKSVNGFLWKLYDGETKNISPYQPKTLNQFSINYKEVKNELEI